MIAPGRSVRSANHAADAVSYISPQRTKRVFSSTLRSSTSSNGGRTCSPTTLSLTLPRFSRRTASSVTSTGRQGELQTRLCPP